MGEWTNHIFSLLVANWEQLLVEGGIVVGVVVFLMGIFKTMVFNRIPNKSLRKTILSFASVLLVAPVTFVYMTVKSWSSDHFWTMYAINSLATIFSYWCYENTHARELLSLIGKKTVLAFINNLRNGDNIKQAATSAVEESKTTIAATHIYKDDDIKKL